MKKIKYSLVIVLITFLFSLPNYAQDSKQDSHQHSGNTKLEMKKDDQKDISDIVRKGTIDLKSIDKNKDGKVFQDQMCWNVISDKPGKCPLCKMVLKEVTLKEAKKNLTVNGFKVK